MPQYELERQVVHKHQTKANDCWYASIQMLKTWRDGSKTKADGKHTQHLHSGILGHRLRAVSAESKHFTYVLTENNLMCLSKLEFSPWNADNVIECLKRYGPIIIGGDYGEFGPVKGLGHYIVLSGVGGTAASNEYKINDPDLKAPEWRSAKKICDGWWNDDESAIVCAS